MATHLGDNFESARKQLSLLGVFLFLACLFGLGEQSKLLWFEVNGLKAYTVRMLLAIAWWGSLLNYILLFNSGFFRVRLIEADMEQLNKSVKSDTMKLERSLDQINHGLLKRRKLIDENIKDMNSSLEDVIRCIPKRIFAMQEPPEKDHFYKALAWVESARIKTEENTKNLDKMSDSYTQDIHNLINRLKNVEENVKNINMGEVVSSRWNRLELWRRRYVGIAIPILIGALGNLMFVSEEVERVVKSAFAVSGS